jgi:hypothetical protein
MELVVSGQKKAPKPFSASGLLRCDRMPEALEPNLPNNNRRADADTRGFPADSMGDGVQHGSILGFP